LAAAANLVVGTVEAVVPVAHLDRELEGLCVLLCANGQPLSDVCVDTDLRQNTSNLRWTNRFRFLHADGVAHRDVSLVLAAFFFVVEQIAGTQLEPSLLEAIA